MPLLGDSRLHLYTQRAYEDFGDTVNEAVTLRYAELVDAGMDTARHLFDWRDLEPSQGTYDLQLVIEDMERAAAAGIRHQFANLVTIDSAGPVVPDFIQDLLDAGAPWDDPRIIGPFNELLDAVVPVMLERDLFMLGLANEPGGYYEDEPAGADSFRDFVASAIERVHLIEPDLAVTVVFAGTEGPALPELLPLVDTATFNTYFYRPEDDPNCQLDGEPLPLWRSVTADRAGEVLDELIDAAQGKLINIQEIGQASAGASLGPDTSEDNQAAVYAALITALEGRRSKFRTVCNWTLNDHDMAWQPLREGLVEDGLPNCYADNVAEIFTLTGLVRSDDQATRKPAFDIFREGIRRIDRLTGDGALTINQGLAGAWYDPGSPGQGIFIDIDPVRGLLFLAWLTYARTGTPDTEESGQRWYTAQGGFDDSTVSELVLYSSTGGRLDDVTNVVTRRIGSVTLRFDDCDAATLQYRLDADGFSDTLPLRRALPEAALLCETLGASGTN